MEFGNLGAAVVRWGFMLPFWRWVLVQPLWHLGVIVCATYCATYAVGSCRRYRAAAVEEFLGLLEGWDGEVREALRYAEEAAAAATVAGDFPAEVDCVIAGGGFKVLYTAGALCFLTKCGIRTRRVAGASAGTLLAFMHVTKSLAQGLRWCFSFGAMLKRFPMNHPGPYWFLFYKSVCDRLDSLPEPGSFVVSLTVVKSLFPPVAENERVESYDSRDDLYEALMASSAVPLITARLPWGTYRGKRVLDGGVTDNAPLFLDGSPVPQLVIRFKTLERRWQGRVAGVLFDIPEMLELFKVGVDDMREFIATAGHLRVSETDRPDQPFAGRLELVPPNLALKRGVETPRVGISSLAKLARSTYSMDGLSSMAEDTPVAVSG